MSRWDKLSMGDRAALVSLFINNGVVNPNEMRRIYDDGGDVENIKPAVAEASYPREREVLDLIDKSDADFVSRLKDENRVTIPDWEGKGETATHKLSYAEVDGKYIVYPLVQNIDGKLYDFSDPQYGMDNGWQAFDSALYAGDYVELPSKANARWFTESYKNHYPGFNKYDGKTEKSQQIVKLGEDDYFIPEELEAAVVTVDSNDKPKIEIPINYLFPERNDVDNKINTLRDVMQDLIDREKKKKSTSVDILKSYRSAYDNPFLYNPFYFSNINKLKDGGELNNSSKITFQDQSRRGLKKAAREAVFNDNPYNPEENDTFLNDYMSDNNIVSFDSKRSKRIFDRNLKKNIKLKNRVLYGDGYGVLPTKDSGYNVIYSPEGKIFTRSEKPLSNEDAIMLAFVPAGGGASLAEKGVQTASNAITKLSPNISKVAFNSYRKIAYPLAKIDYTLRPSTYLAKLMNRAGFSKSKTAAAGLATDIGLYNIIPGAISYNKYTNTGNTDYKSDAINSMIGIFPNIMGKYIAGTSYIDDYITKLNKQRADNIFDKTILFDSSLANSSSFRNRPRIRRVNRLGDAYAEYSSVDNVVNLPYVDNVYSLSNVGNPKALDSSLSHEFQHVLTDHSYKSSYTIPSKEYYTAAHGFSKFLPFYKNYTKGMNWKSSPDEFLSNMAEYNFLMGTSGKRLDELNKIQRMNYINNMSKDFNMTKQEVEDLIRAFESGII